MSDVDLTEPYFEIGLEGWSYVQPTYGQVIESLYGYGLEPLAFLHSTMTRYDFLEVEGFIRFDTIAKKLNGCGGMTLWSVVAVFDTKDHALLAKLSL